ncbi:MAG: hypothetical protein ACT4PJ_10665 [Gemmatimonadaceae bacterium]
MKATFTIVGVLTLTMIAPRAEAQESRVKLGAAFGPGWETRGAGGPSGTHFALSATLRPTASRYGWRLETMLDDAERRRGGAAANESGLHRHATFGLTLSAVRRFSKSQTGVYAIAGIGLYHQWNEVVARSDATAEEKRQGIWSNAHPGLNVGLGYNFLIKGQEMFIESRYHTRGFESRIPLSLGIRI